MKIPRARIHSLVRRADINHCFDNQVRDLGFLLELALSDEEDGVHGGVLELLKDGRPEDQIAHAGLVFQGNEECSIGRGRALTD